MTAAGVRAFVNEARGLVFAVRDEIEVRHVGPIVVSGMTVAEIKQASTGWNRPMLEAALEYEQAHAQRKGAVAAIESALAGKEDDS